MSTSLNGPQREAVEHPGGPLLVFAGAGSGKTRVITHRVAYLAQSAHVPAWRILAVTFTNKAAEEMRHRLARLLGPEGGKPWVGTFHATCAKLLRLHAGEIGVRRDFVIYDDSDQKAMLSRILRDMGLDERRHSPKLVAGAINRAKQELVGPDAFPRRNANEDVVQGVYRTYEERMARSGALDFGDLIYRLVVALEHDPVLGAAVANRFDHVLVDEFQDTNRAQYRLVRVLAAPHRNACVVGDDDQSIYRWRGADRRNILSFRGEFPDARVVRLEQNYRSTKRILRAAHAVISRCVEREPKELWTENPDGPSIVVVTCEDERDEARMVVRAVREVRAEGRSTRSMAVFYRTHAQSRVLEEALRGADIAYQVVGGMRFYDRAEIKDILAYLRVLQNPDDDVSLLRIINTPPRGIGKTTIERLLDVAARGGTGLWAVLVASGDIPTLGGAVRRKLRDFVAVMEDLRAHTGGGLVALAERVVNATGYLQALQDQDTPEADARTQNLLELVGSIEEFEDDAEDATLAAFLELVTLHTNVDDMADDDRLTLMTVHAAKGLEFPVVVVTGLEEDLFPMRGDRPGEDPEELEEERRLAYVAMTRAQERLILSHALERHLFGQWRRPAHSRFLDELPAQDVQRVGAVEPSPSWAQPSWSRPRTTGLGESHVTGAEPDEHRSAPVPPGQPGESYVDPLESSDLQEVRVGMRVRHTRFGVGTVVAIPEGIPPRVRVQFPGWGTKPIVLKYLEPL